MNYRYQAMVEGPGRPAFSPRVSVVLPFGSVPRGLGDGSAGLQFNLPFSKQIGDWYWHWNAGLTWLPQAELDDTREENLASPVPGRERDLPPAADVQPDARKRSGSRKSSSATSAPTRETLFTLSPGARGGWNLGDHQLILGLAIPITWGGGRDRDRSVHLRIVRAAFQAIGAAATE